MVVWLVVWLCTWEILSVYITEAGSCGETGLCVGDFCNTKEYIVFRIMVQYSPVLGGTDILEEHWCQQTRVQHGILS